MNGKKTGCVRLLALALTALCACGGKPDAAMQQALALRTALGAAGGCTFTAEVTADYGEKIYAYTMECVCETDAGARFTLRAPQTLAGISAEISADGTHVSYEDTEVGFSALAGGRLAPMQLPWLLADGWYSGRICAAGREDGAVRVSCQLGYGEQTLTLDTWLGEDGFPQKSAVSFDGQTLLTAEIQNFSLERSNDYEYTQKNVGGDISGPSGA